MRADALKSAAIEVPSASPLYPMSRYSTTLIDAFTRTVATLTFTGVRAEPSA